MQEAGTDFNGEEWRPVVGYEGWYEVSSRGRVRRIPRAAGTRADRILKVQPSNRRRRTALLSKGETKGKGRKRIPVATLVAAAFIGPRPTGHEVNHKDGDRQHDAAINLEYVTSRRNYDHAVEMRLYRHGGQNWMSKLDANKVREIRRLLGTTPITHIAARFGVTEMTIHGVKSGRTWRHVQDEPAHSLSA